MARYLINLVSFSFLITISVTALSNAEIWYPDKGAIAYNGSKGINAIMQWTKGASLSYWLNDPPRKIGEYSHKQRRGFEFDLSIRAGFFSRAIDCTSSGTFLEFYDDCPTAGVLDGTLHKFGCGTHGGAQFAIDPLNSNRGKISHRCDFKFHTDSTSPLTQGSLDINVQTVFNGVLGLRACRRDLLRDWIWCKQQEQNVDLTTPPFNSGRYTLKKGSQLRGIWGNYDGTPPPMPIVRASTPVINGISNVALNRYGYNFGTNQHKDHLIVRVDNASSRSALNMMNSAQNYSIKFRGYDIDFNDEVAIYINEVFYGYISRGNNNRLNGLESIVIDGDYFQLDKNRIKFVQSYSGQTWGVELVSILPTSSRPTPLPQNTMEPTILLEYGQLDENQYGNYFGSVQRRNKLRTLFQNIGSSTRLKVKGYSVLSPTQIGVYLNNRLLGHLSVGPFFALNNGDTFQISKNDLISGNNILEFRNIRSVGTTWGVTDILIEEVPDNILLILQLLLLDEE